MNEKTPVKTHDNDMPLENGMLNPKTLNQLFRVATCYVKSGILPKEYNSPEKVITALQFARELGLPGLTSLREIAVINGKPSIYGTLPLSIVQSSGLMEWHEEFYLDSDHRKICDGNKNIAAKVFASVTIVKRKNDPHPLTQTYTLAQAESAGLMRNAVWKSYPERMLRYRSRSMALKDKFADVLGGTAIKEYDVDIAPESKRSIRPVAGTISVESVNSEPIINAKTVKVESHA